MPINRLLMVLALSICFVTAQEYMQTTRTEQIEREKTEKAASVRPEVREKGDVIITKLEQLFMPQPPAVRLTFGDFRPGANFALGVAYAAPFGRALWTNKAAWSVENFKQVGSVLELPPVAGDRLRINTFVRWNDAPDLPYFGLGNTTSRADEVSYGLRSIEAGFEVQARAGRWFLYGASAGYLGARSSEGAGPEPPIGSIFTNENAPGLGSKPAWVHSSGHAAIDTRESPGYTQHGALYSLTFHHYWDRGGQFSFDLTEIDLRQFIPVLHNNWIIALQGRADITSSAQGQVIPYFMLPTLGGRDTLPGFAQYRFADRDSLLLRSELRWAASPLVDMAVIFDMGKVAPRIADLDFRGLKRSWGLGMRFHGPKFTALGIGVAHSIEGWRFNFSHSLSF